MPEDASVQLPERVPSPEEQATYAAQLVQSLKPEEKAALVAWAEEMMLIRATPGSKLSKAKSAIKATKARKVLWPLLHALYKSLRGLGWSMKLAVLAGAIAAVVFPGAGSGIAAFGGAIGLPLWVVLGAGGAFAGAIVDAARSVGSTREV